MKTMANYLIIMFSVMLFIFRLAVLFTTSMEIEFVVRATNVNFEVAYIFRMFISIIALSRNKLWGGILYLLSSLVYLGPTFWNEFQAMSNGTSVETATEMLVTLICMVIPIFAFFIIALAKRQEKSPVDKKTDFFYKTDAYDRKYDEIADRSNYRTL